jgi:hypothetical protein
MFRKLYWVSEQLDQKGKSRVVGVYTSIPNLITHGLAWSSDKSRLRLTLAKLDSDKEPFGMWCEPHFHTLPEDLQEFVETDEFTQEHCQMLAEALKSRSAIAA